MLEQMHQFKMTHGVSIASLVKQTSFSYASIMRWKSRVEKGLPPVLDPGPKKVPTDNLHHLKDDLAALHHGQKKTYGTGRIYEKYQSQISRRELNRLIIAARREYYQKKADHMQMISWHYPDVGWSLDGFEMTAGKNGQKLFVCNVQDLCSQYKFYPISTRYLPCGEEISGHLSHLFKRFGPPLFIKRDNGGNLNHSSVDDTLDEFMVIPINNPEYYAPYNGAIEHSNGELKRYHQDWCWKVRTNRDAMLLTELAAHDLNHRERRALRGRNSCIVYNCSQRIKYDKRKRKEVFLQIKEIALKIFSKSDNIKMFNAAWRVAVKYWLQKNNLITIVRGKKVLPYFSLNLCHN